MPLYSTVDQELLDVAHEVLAYPDHAHLVRARIGFIFQIPASTQDGRLVLGRAQRIGERQQAAGLALDFLITIAEDQWNVMSPERRMALLDHELSHCGGNSVDGWKLRTHEVQEFLGVIDRHGLYRFELSEMAEIIQRRLPLEIEAPAPALVAVDAADLTRQLQLMQAALKANHIEI